MNKTKIFYKISDVMANQARGDFWITFLQTYFNPEKILIYSGMLKVLFKNIPTETLIIGSAIFFFLIQLLKWGIGEIDKRMGLWKKQQEYNNKAEHLAPVQNQINATLESICKAVGAEYKITKL